jgi:hypothetical protein
MSFLPILLAYAMLGLECSQQSVGTVSVIAVATGLIGSLFVGLDEGKNDGVGFDLISAMRVFASAIIIFAIFRAFMGP